MYNYSNLYYSDITRTFKLKAIIHKIEYLKYRFRILGVYMRIKLNFRLDRNILFTLSKYYLNYKGELRRCASCCASFFFERICLFSTDDSSILNFAEKQQKLQERHTEKRRKSSG